MWSFSTTTSRIAELCLEPFVCLHNGCDNEKKKLKIAPENDIGSAYTTRQLHKPRTAVQCVQVGMFACVSSLCMKLTGRSIAVWHDSPPINGSDRINVSLEGHVNDVTRWGSDTEPRPCVGGGGGEAQGERCSADSGKERALSDCVLNDNKCMLGKSKSL